MSDELFYSTGTISLTNGSAAVTGSGTLWQLDADYPRLMEGDELVVSNGSEEPVPYRILTIDSDTTLTLSRNYEGTTQSGRTYIIYKTSPFRNETPRLLDWVRDLIDSVGAFADVYTLVDVASAVNSFQISNAISGSYPKLEAIGANTNVGIDYIAKGTGNHRWTISAAVVATLTATMLTVPSIDVNATGIPDNGFYEPAANTLGAASAGVHRAAITGTANGTRLVLGGTVTSVTTGSISPGIQLKADAQDYASMSLILAETATPGPVFGIYKGRSSLASPTICGNSDTIADFRFGIYDGVDWNSYGARIVVSADGTLAENVVYAKMRFYTNDGAAAPTERWIITTSGNLEPFANNTHSVGSASLRMANVHTQVLTTYATTTSTSTTTGSLINAGGFGNAGTAWIGGALNVTATTASSSTTTGAIINGGGLGVAGAAYIGGVLNVAGVANFANGSESAPSISRTADPDTGLYFNASNNIAVTTAGAVIAVFRGSTIGFGSTGAAAVTDFSGNSVSILQIHGVGVSSSWARGSMAVAAWNSTTTIAASAGIMLSKSAADAFETYTAVASATYLGHITFSGADGTDFAAGTIAARIIAQCAGAVSTNVVPGRLIFMTTTSAGTSTNRMLIEPSGEVTPGANNAQELGTSALRWSTIYAQNALNTSDERAKKNLKLVNVLDRIKDMNVYEYDYYDSANLKDGIFTLGKEYRRSIGVVAQEARHLFPEIVFGDEDKELLSISESKIGVIALAGLKEYASETDKRIADLTVELAAAKERITQLEARH